MNKDARTFIAHILECIELIEKYTDNKTEEDFFDSFKEENVKNE